jgi:hypothetical protein
VASTLNYKSGKGDFLYGGYRYGGLGVGARGRIRRLDSDHFELSNTGKAAHFLRAIEATSSKLADGTTATLQFRDQSISITARGGKLRFEIEDSMGLAPGEALELALETSEQDTASWLGSFSNVAYVGTGGGLN